MRKYTKSHEWAEVISPGTVRVGISQHAAEQIGDIVFIELPSVGATYSSGDEFAVLESVKAASGVYSPVDGEVTAVNDNLSEEEFGVVGKEPEGDGWLCEMKVEDVEKRFGEMMDEAEYKSFIENS